MKKLFSILTSIIVIANTTQADDSKWKFNPYDFQYDMTIYITINIDGGADNLSGYIVGAFYEDECRGIVEIRKYGDLQYGYLRVRSNKESGELITFKIYDINTNEELRCKDVLNFTSAGVVGVPSNPKVLYAANKYKVDYILDNEIYLSKYLYFGDDIDIIEAPEREGYEFLEWGDVPDSMPSKDIILIGIYKMRDSYKFKGSCAIVRGAG